MNKLHRAGSALAPALLACAAHATPISTDASDLWYNPQESGWGVSLYQQQETVFAVLFVYGPNNQPIWYVASGLQAGLTVPGGNLAFAGPLHQTTGPYFGAATFNPAAVNTRQVGTATFTLTNLTSGTFVYSVDGVSVSKIVVRQTWRINNMTGSYLGGQSGTYSSCPAPSGNGPRDEPGTLTVNHGDGSATMSLVTSAFSCTYNGAYGQGGHYGLMSGAYSCSNGSNGSFNAFGIDTQITSFSARIDTAASDGCRYSGRIGGVRRPS